MRVPRAEQCRDPEGSDGLLLEHGQRGTPIDRHGGACDTAAMATIDPRIIGQNLPGLRCRGHKAVHVGLQRKTRVVEIVPGDAAQTVSQMPLTAATGDEGNVSFRGPLVDGRQGEQFPYLSGGDLGAEGGLTMCRRAELHLSALRGDGVAGALSGGGSIAAVLDRADARGNPRSPSPRPPQTRWHVIPPTFSSSASIEPATARGAVGELERA